MKKVLIFVLPMFLFSCGDSEKKPISIPDTVLPAEKMAQVLADVHIAEAEATLKALPDSTAKNKINFREIFRKDSITKAQYDSSIVFYVGHPELLDTIYVQVLNELSKMQAGNK